MTKKGTILVVDDNKTILQTLRLLLNGYFERVLTIASPNRIDTVLREEAVDIVLLDMNFSAGINSGNEGIYWLTRIKKINANIPVVVFTAYADIDLAVRAIKEGAAETVELLKARGMRVAMLTGDNQTCAKAVAESVGIGEFVAEVLPQDKLKAVQNVQTVGGVVAMVGDGINDSPALKQADVGIAIGSGTDVAIDSAGVVLVSDDIRSLDTAFDLSRAAVRNIKENLFWAFIYNVVMIPVAAGAFYALGFTFNPMIAAACMSLSSLFVVGNALRLLLYKNKNLKPAKSCGAACAVCPPTEEKEEGMKKIISIEGMCCEHCAARVEKALSAVHNVVSADVKLKKNCAVVRSRQPVSDEEIRAVVTEAGYTVTAIEDK